MRDNQSRTEELKNLSYFLSRFAEAGTASFGRTGPPENEMVRTVLSTMAWPGVTVPARAVDAQVFQVFGRHLTTHAALPPDYSFKDGSYGRIRSLDGELFGFAQVTRTAPLSATTFRVELKNYYVSGSWNGDPTKPSSTWRGTNSQPTLDGTGYAIIDRLPGSGPDRYRLLEYHVRLIR